MPRTSQIAFSGGEVTPAIDARLDQDKFYTSVRRMENFLPAAHGGASKRDGFEFCGLNDTRDANLDTVWYGIRYSKLIPFNYDLDSAFALLLTPCSVAAGAGTTLYTTIRILKDNAYVVPAPPLHVVSVRSSTYKWTASGGGTDTWYLELAAGGDPGLDQPQFVYEAAGEMLFVPSSRIAALAAGEWTYGDNDSLGYDTLYMRTVVTGDPDSRALNYFYASYSRALAIIGASRMYQWTVSPSTAGEYYLEAYGGGDPGVELPLAMKYAAGAGVTSTTPDLTRGEPGSLDSDSWGWGDNDSLGYDTLYLKIGIDPDSAGAANLVAVYPREIYVDFYPSDGTIWEVDGVELGVMAYENVRYAQDRAALHIDHQSMTPKRLVFESSWQWTWEDNYLGAYIGAPVAVSATYSKTAGLKKHTIYYVITAVDASGNESPVSDELDVEVDNKWQGDEVVDVVWTAPTSGTPVRYHIYKKDAGFWGYIGWAEGLSFVDSNVVEDQDYSPPDYGDPFSTSNDRPMAVAMFQQRLCHANTANEPQRIVTSRTGALRDYGQSQVLRDDDSVEFTPYDNEAHEILHLVALRDLIAFSRGTEFRINGWSGAITPLDIAVDVISRYGCNHVAPQTVGDSAVFCSRSGREVHDTFYSVDAEGYVGNDLTALVGHLFERYGIIDWAYVKTQQVIWVVRLDGTLLSLTYDRNKGIYAWARHPLEGKAMSVCSVIGERHDKVYLLTRTWTNGAIQEQVLLLKRWSEADVEDARMLDYHTSRAPVAYIDPSPGAGVTQADPVVVTTTSAHGLTTGDRIRIQGVKGMSEINNYFLTVVLTSTTFSIQDTGGTDVDGTSFGAYLGGGAVYDTVNRLYGLEHLEGEEVTIVAEGAKLGTATVTDGAIDLPQTCGNVSVGLPYQGLIETHALEAGIDSITGKERCFKNVVLKLKDAAGGEVGQVEDDTVNIKYRQTQHPPGRPISLVTDDVQVSIPPKWKRQAHLFIKHDDPSPFTLLGIVPELDHASLSDQR